MKATDFADPYAWIMEEDKYVNISWQDIGYNSLARLKEIQNTVGLPVQGDITAKNFREWALIYVSLLKRGNIDLFPNLT